MSLNLLDHPGNFGGHGDIGLDDEPIAGQTITITDGRQSFRLQPYECRLFLPKK